MSDVTDQIAKRPARMSGAAPFWGSVLVIVLAALATLQGGWWLLSVPVVSIGLFSLLDAIGGLDERNTDPTTQTDHLFWYRLVTLVWFPVQMALVYSALWAVTSEGSALSDVEKVVLFVILGSVAGAVGIVYAHELMHQGTRLERWLGDLLMGMVLYGHFRSEHLLVHHRYVGTPRDPVTARYNEGFHRFFARVLVGCVKSAWRAEAALLARKGRPVWHRANPFWRYLALQVGFLALAGLIGGAMGLGLYLVMAAAAILHLEVINYIEHYGLTRKHLGEGRYEHVQPHHSWNANHRASNWLLINLQRHSDHHFRPNRRFPLLQAYPKGAAPQLPFGYPLMFVMALMPPVWRRVMNPRVRAWRREHYPEITDWAPYKAGTTPLPKGIG